MTDTDRRIKQDKTQNVGQEHDGKERLLWFCNLFGLYSILVGGRSRKLNGISRVDVAVVA